MSTISIILTTMILNNVVTHYCLGINTHINNRKAIIPIGIISTLTILISAILVHFIKLYYLNTILVIVIGVGMAYLSNYILSKYFNNLYERMEINSETMLVNTLIFSISALIIPSNYDLINVLLTALSMGIGYIVISYIFNSLINELGNDPIPTNLRGWPLFLIVLGIIALMISRI